jgi:hypothetical protein
MFVCGLTLSFATFAFSQGSSVEDLKAQIVQIASANQVRTDNYKEVRTQLAPLVEEIVAATNQSPDERIQGKFGTWQQLWTDDADDTRPNNFFTQIDRSRTFQIVDPKGFFYNVSEMETALNVRLTAFLRGEYQKQGDGIKIKFTNLDIKVLGVKDPARVAQLLEAKKEKFFPATRFAKYPKGPVGAEGYIDTVYVDSDLRIDYGYNAADKIVDMFILQRL